MEEEYVFMKEDIANYLFDFYNIMAIASFKPDKSFWNVFTYYIGTSNRCMYANKLYYNEMVNIFCFYLLKNINSTLYDVYFNDVTCNDVVIDKKMFVNPSDSKYFNSKQVVKYIRNALNHNDNHETYILKRIGYQLYVEIKLQDVRTNKEKKLNNKPKPFHIILSFEELYNIFNKAFSSLSPNSTIYINTEGIDDLKANNCYSKLNKVRITKDYYKDGKIYYQREFKLNNLQKLKIKEDLAEWEKKCAKGSYIVPYMIMSVLPFPEFRRMFELLLLDIAVFYYKLHSEKSFDIMLEEVKQMLFQKSQGKSSINEFPLYDSLKYFQNDASKLCAVCDWDLFVQTCCFVYCGYILDTIINDENVTIDNRNIQRNRLRNSFVHSRWAPSKNANYIFYDWRNDCESEYNPKSASFWNDFISMNALNEAAIKYNQVINNNHFIDLPIIIDKKYKGNLPEIIYFVKNGIMWFVSFGNDYGSKTIPWGIYKIDSNNYTFVEDEKEIAFFLNEIYKIPNLKEDFYDTFCNYIKKQNLETQKYYHKLITLKQLIELHRDNNQNEEEKAKILK